MLERPYRVCMVHELHKLGVRFENTSETEPLVVLRYFGPEVNPDAPEVGGHKKRKFD